jgi:NAD(P)-dependent dehydrogenase (short-subunit alcohol dehydrogenase family)
MNRLEGKVAFVTGASKGIGFSVAERLLEMGARVFICGREAETIEKAARSLSSKGETSGIVCDVRDEDQVKKAIAQCVAQFGGLDILVNNAGFGIFGKTVEEMTSDEFRSIIETNLLGVFYACHESIPLMKARGGGYIINISSLAGQNAHPRMAAYNASKFGLNGFTEAMMQEVRADGIKVTAICPGSVNTFFGGDVPSEEKAWQIQAEDIADIVQDLLEMNSRTLPSRIEVRPSNPPKK